MSTAPEIKEALTTDYIVLSYVRISASVMS